MTKTDPTRLPARKMKNNVVPLPAAEQRPSEKIVAFVKQHPALTVAGAVVAGLAVSALLPRKTSRRILGKAVNLAEAAGTATAIWGRKTDEKAHALGRSARKQALLTGHRAEKAGHMTAHQLEKYGLAALAAASALGRGTAARASKLSNAAVETAGRIGDAAVERSHKVKAMADDLKDRMTH